MSNNGYIVEATALAKSYKRGSEAVAALKDGTFYLNASEVVALVGPSGSGKTTLLNILCGWEQADSGEIKWDGQTHPDLARLPWADVAIVPQRLGLIEELSVAENIELPERLRDNLGAETDERVGHLMARLGLDALGARLPSETSLGEQQRTALARALVLSPKLLLADEPAGHQDGGWAQSVFAMMQEAAVEGTCCLVATHNAQTIKFCDRTLEIDDGAIHERSSGGSGA